MMRLSIEDRFKTAKEISRDLADRNRRPTVERKGFMGKTPAKKPFLNKKKMKESRLKWSKQYEKWTLEDWRKVLFSDKSKFNIFSSDGTPYVIRHTHERFYESCTLKTVKHAASVMIWECFSYFGLGHINVIDRWLC